MCGSSCKQTIHVATYPLKFFFCAFSEHGIQPDGRNPDKSDDGSYGTFFEETGMGQCVPRNVTFVFVF